MLQEAVHITRRSYSQDGCAIRKGGGSGQRPCGLHLLADQDPSNMWSWWRQHACKGRPSWPCRDPAPVRSRWELKWAKDWCMNNVEYIMRIRQHGKTYTRDLSLSLGVRGHWMSDKASFMEAWFSTFIMSLMARSRCFCKITDMIQNESKCFTQTWRIFPFYNSINHYCMEGENQMQILD